MQVTTRLGIVLCISLTFFAAEIAVGFKTKSLALIADAFHYLNDVVAYAIAYAAAYVSPQSAFHTVFLATIRQHVTLPLSWLLILPRPLLTPIPFQLQTHGKHTSQFTYAFNRAELVGAFFNGVFLLALGLSIALQSLERFVNLQEIDNPMLVLIIGCVGLLLNATSALVVGHAHPGHSHSHGHDHDHDHSKESDLDANYDQGIDLHMDPITRSTNAAVHADHYHTLEPAAIQPPVGANLGLVGVLIHLLGDAVNNVAVIIAAVIIWKLRSHSRFYADPAVSLGISLIIFASAIPLTKKCGRILLEAAPVHLDLEKIRDDILSLPDVLSIHDLHVWHLSQSDILASLHVCVATETSMSEWSRIENHIQQCFEAYGVKHVTVSPELPHLPLPPSYHAPSQLPSRTGSQRRSSHGDEGVIDTAGSGGSGPAASQENSDGGHDAVEALEGVTGSTSVNVTGTCGIPIPEKEGFGCSMGRLRKVHRSSGSPGVSASASASGAGAQDV
ncbi:hypothetical protein D9758_009260 [Tetrapyrgos nigripes]|uniref:Cation efflux protein n=1 Tax=Tetrapyrgos nigripes TaxID=182062 RepID=A0A8H5FX43_9AGAR|nr:hypothetical protein D9758_009260 [Tetrapyrgos nigripes]